jgi:plasmid stabilization system protein ParE
VYVLSRRAALDLARILTELINDEERAGPEIARRVDVILDDCMDRIADGRIPGHRRADIRPRHPLLFAVDKPTRYVIAFDPTTRKIVRVVHGSMDFRRIFRNS